MIAAVIATRYHPPQLSDLLRVLISDGVEPIVLRSEVFDHHLYRMWNVGVEEARAKGAAYIAVLNDDVGLPRCAMGALGEALDRFPDVGVVYPDVASGSLESWTGGSVIQRTTGTWGAGGMTGFCFMFRADLGISFDEDWGLWYGDDAFEEAVRASGMAVARVVGVPVRHTPQGSTSRDMGHWGPIIAADRARWDALHA